jgi:hypothetical protein
MLWSRNKTRGMGAEHGGKKKTQSPFSSHGGLVRGVAQRTRLLGGRKRVARREGVYLHGDLEEVFLERECIERKRGGSANLYKEVTVFVIWGDRVPGCVAFKHAYLFTLFKYLSLQ